MAFPFECWTPTKDLKSKSVENKLPSGAYEVEILDTQSGLIFSSDYFAVKRGNKRVVKISTRRHQTQSIVKIPVEYQKIQEAIDSNKPEPGRYQFVVGKVISNDGFGDRFHAYFDAIASTSTGYKIQTNKKLAFAKNNHVGREVVVFRNAKQIATGKVDKRISQDELSIRQNKNEPDHVQNGDIVLMIVDTKGTNDSTTLKPQTSADSRLQARTEKTKKKMETVFHACQRFKSDCGRWPARISELWQRPADLKDGRWKGEYLARVMNTDDWGNNFWTHDNFLTHENENRFSIISMGPDGELGTSDDLAIVKINNPQHGVGKDAGQTLNSNLRHLKPIPLTKLFSSKRNDAARICLALDENKLFETVYHRAQINDMSLDRNQNWLAVGGDDGVIRIWDWKLSSDGVRLRENLSNEKISISQSSTKKITTQRRRIRHILPCGLPVHRSAWSPNDNILAVACYDPTRDQGKILLWKVVAKKAELIFQLDHICYELSFSNDGTRLAIQDKAGVRILELTQSPRPKLLPNHGLAGSITKKAWSPDGKFLAVTKQNGIDLWDVEQRKVHHHFPSCSNAGYILDLDNTPLLAMIRSKERRPRNFEIADCQTFDSILVAPLTNAFHSLRFSSCFNGYALASKSEDEFGQRGITIEAGFPIDQNASHRWGAPQFEISFQRHYRATPRFPFAVDQNSACSHGSDETLTGLTLQPKGKLVAMSQSFDNHQTDSGFVEIQHQLDRKSKNNKDHSDDQPQYRAEVRLVDALRNSVHRLLDYRCTYSHNTFLRPEQIAYAPNSQLVAICTLKSKSNLEYGIKYFKDSVKQTEIKLPGKRRLAPNLTWSPNQKYLIAHDNHDLHRLDIFKPSDPKFHVHLSVKPGSDGRIVTNSNDKFLFCKGNRILWRHQPDSLGFFDLETGNLTSEMKLQLPEDGATTRRRSGQRPMRLTIYGFDWNPETEQIAVAYKFGNQQRTPMRVQVARQKNGEFEHSSDRKLTLHHGGWFGALRFIKITPDGKSTTIGYINKYRENPTNGIGEPKSKLVINRIPVNRDPSHEIKTTLSPEDEFECSSDKIATYRDGVLTDIDLNTGKVTQQYVGDTADFQESILKPTLSGWILLTPRQVRVYDKNLNLKKTIVKTDWSHEAAVATVYPDGKLRQAFEGAFQKATVDLVTGQLKIENK